MANEQYWFYVEHGICPRCKKQKALPNRRYCGDCLHKLSEEQIQRYHRMTENNLRQINKRLRIRYQERKSKGICVTCGKKRAITSEVRCLECKEKARKLNEDYRRRKGAVPRISYGDGFHCVICGAEVENKNLCDKCRSTIYEK